MDRRTFGKLSAGYLASRALKGQILSPILFGIGSGSSVSIPTNGLIGRYEQASNSGSAGTALSSLVDSSGSGNNCTQGTGANQPTINTAGVSGRTICFESGNGVQRYMNFPAGVTFSTQNFGVIFVMDTLYSANSNSSYLCDFTSVSNAFSLNFNSGSPAGKLGVPGHGSSNQYVPWGTQMVGFTGAAGGSNFIFSNVFTSSGAIASASPAGGVLNCYGSNTFNPSTNLYMVLVYNRTLLQADIDQIYSYAQATYKVYGTSSYMLLGGVGDSLTAGFVASAYNGLGWMNQWLTANPTYTAYNFAITGSKIAALAVPDTIYSASPTKRICFIWSGTNDNATGTAGTWVAGALSSLSSYVSARRTTGWKCVTATMLPRTGGVTNASFETDRQTFNTALTTNAGGIYGDAISNIGGDATIGQAGDQTNLTYYMNDAIHLNQAGNAIAYGTYFGPSIASL